MEKVEKIITLLENGQHEEALKSYKYILNSGTNEERVVLGEELFRYGFLEEAKILFEKLLKVYPEEGELLVLYAETLIELGEEDQAMLALSEIHEEDPSYPQSLLLLADLYQMQGLYEVSEQKLQEAKSILPDEIILDFALGELYLEEGKFVEAIRSYSKVIDTKSEIAGVNVHQRLGDAYSAGGSFEEALDHYEKALNDQMEINTLFNYALTAFQAGMNKKAIEKFTELKELDPDYHSLYLYLAKSYEREGDLEQSIETVKQGINYDEFNKDLFFYGGKLAIKLGRDEEAIDLFQNALALDPEFIEAALVLSRLYLKREDYDDVLMLLKEMKENGMEEPQLLWDEAVALWHLEEYSQALNKYENAYNYFKNDTNFLTDYAYFLMEEGKRQEAAELFTKVLTEDPSNEDIQEILERLTDDIARG